MTHCHTLLPHTFPNQGLSHPTLSIKYTATTQHVPVHDISLLGGIQVTKSGILVKAALGTDYVILVQLSLLCIYLLKVILSLQCKVFVSRRYPIKQLICHAH